jgi:hypothetical protein
VELAPEPDRPESADDAPRRARHLAAAPEIDPEERGRAYDAARAAADDSGYWHEVPRFRQMWADHADRWPPHAPDRSFTLTPEREQEVDKAISQVRLIEPNVSAEMTEVARDNTSSAWLEGFDHRLKGDARLKEKIAGSAATSSPDATPAELMRAIPDAIRYTFCANADTYVGAYHEIKGLLESLGYEMYQCKNFWNNAEYKGINTRWETREGWRFEVQLHTPESFHAKHHVTHESYERLRSIPVGDVERGELETFQRAVCSRLRIPDGASGLPDFKKDGY